ncbi:putative glycerol kinase 5 isoform X2 [Watersipora subatra]
MSCMGITTFRNSFLLWDRDTGEHFGNINTWQDTRTKDIVKSWNNSLILATVKSGAGILHALTRSQKFKAGRAVKFLTAAVSVRLKWLIDNNEKLQSRVNQQKVMFGTLETWLLWKLSGEKVWITDRASASGTLLYDTFQGTWSSLLCGLVGIPLHILPEISSTCITLAVCDSSIFGHNIPITASMADQQASLFGHCCFDLGDIKLTLGTGSFLNVNTGVKPLAFVTGIYPLVAWEIGQEVTFCAEGNTVTLGTCMDWLKSVGIIANVAASSDMAKSVSDTNNCYFVPAFSGLAAPINDDSASGLLIGLSASVTAAHITRAVLESFAFVIKLQYETMLADCGRTVNHIRVDGGVANNDFVLQCIADVLQKPIHRPHTLNMTSRGAAFMAGLGAKIWTSLEELKSLKPDETVFQPQETSSYYKKAFTNWEKAVSRSKAWHTA